MSKFQQVINQVYMTLNEQEQPEELTDLPDLPEQEGEQGVDEMPTEPPADNNDKENAKPLADTERVQLLNIAAKAALVDTNRLPHAIKLKLDGEVSTDNIDEIRDILTSLIDTQTV